MLANRPEGMPVHRVDPTTDAEVADVAYDCLSAERAVLLEVLLEPA
jgi:hypothetical protein